MYLLRWLTSRTVRKGAELAGTVRKILNHQRDSLSAEAIQMVEGALKGFEQTLRGGAGAATVREQMDALEHEANKWLKPYPNAGLRENLVMILEIAILIIGSRAFLIQPMVIPTGSAQPTLYGITSTDLRDKPEMQFPAWPQRIWERCIQGVSYKQVKAKQDCVLTRISQPFTPPFKFALPVVKCVQLDTSAGSIRVWFPPEHYLQHWGLVEVAGVQARPKKSHFRAGEDIIKARVVSGDRLFVERVTYNFRRPKRGETIVFRSENHPGMTPRTHYIKRLVGLGGERIRIGDDRHTYINGRPLTTNDFGFEQVFAFDPAQPPRSDHYSGHVNGTVWRAATGESGPTPNFPNGTTEVTIRPKHYVCFGDNTMNSADSRYWGEPDFPQERVIGKSWFVFWPFTKRFGWGN